MEPLLSAKYLSWLDLYMHMSTLSVLSVQISAYLPYYLRVGYQSLFTHVHLSCGNQAGLIHNDVQVSCHLLHVGPC